MTVLDTAPAPQLATPAGGPRTVFVSYAPADAWFVPLLVRLLEVHQHTVSTDESIAGGPRIVEAISEQLREADTMIVIISASAAGSPWVEAEIAEFRAMHPHGLLIPLVIERTTLDDLDPQLQTLQAIDCYSCMLAGFERLFESLGGGFLAPELLNDRRASDRRTVATRREGVERRRCGLEQRMQVGFLMSYGRETGRYGIDPMKCGPTTSHELVAALSEEIRRYSFKDPVDGSPVDPHRALSAGIDHVWDDLGDAARHDATVVFPAIAEHICGTFAVRMVERRDGQRRGDGDRRESD